MELAQFEQAVLQMVHGGGAERLTPSQVAYHLRVSVKDAERMLDKLVTNAVLELDSDDDGNLFYFVPGHSRGGVFTSGTVAEPPRDSSPTAAPSGGNPAWGQAPPQPSTGDAFAGRSTPAGYGPHTQPGAPPYGPYAQGSHQGGGSGPGYHGAPQHPGAPPVGAAAYGQYGQPHGAWSPQQVGPYGPPPPHAGPYGPPQHPGAPQAGMYGHQQYGGAGAPIAPFGRPTPYSYGQNALVPTTGPGAPRSPGAAGLLSFFFPGSGQLYNGQVGKGLAFFFMTCFLLTAPPLAVVPWMWSALDAYQTAKRQNQKNQTYGLLNP